MKRICRAVVFAALAVMLLVPQLAWASNNDFDSGDDQNIVLSLSSDKSSYEEGERAEVKLTIENSGGSDLGEVAYTFKLPEEMVATESGSLTGTIANIGAGESSEITLEADVISSSSSSRKAQSDGPTKLAQTGDTLLLVVSFGLFLLLECYLFGPRKEKLLRSCSLSRFAWAFRFSASLKFPGRATRPFRRSSP